MNTCGTSGPKALVCGDGLGFGIANRFVESDGKVSFGSVNCELLNEDGPEEERRFISIDERFAPHQSRHLCVYEGTKQGSHRQHRVDCRLRRQHRHSSLHSSQHGVKTTLNPHINAESGLYISPDRITPIHQGNAA